MCLHELSADIDDVAEAAIRDVQIVIHDLVHIQASLIHLLLRIAQPFFDGRLRVGSASTKPYLQILD
jgi:hypothetical protein